MEQREVTVVVTMLAVSAEDAETKIEEALYAHGSVLCYVIAADYPVDDTDEEE